ncbi:hypothetical protein M413DRAFT_442110 [Hebeloma cylindrosporum]|uniref:BZIP domain-containing protein n=1 Tax=Hebeloma cylindrosporum TaxID=76867 RepID=A0A0C2Y6D8_HEBCY|nr:hypothetical protein M413DRAFT_442110 [Hebeloma cylindrosporum h7]
MASGYKKSKPTSHAQPQRVIAAKKAQKKKSLRASKRRNDDLREQLDLQSNALPIHGISQSRPASTTQQPDLSQSLLDVTTSLLHL